MLAAAGMHLHAEALTFPHISKRPAAADNSCFQSRLTTESFLFDEEKADGFQMDFRSCDLGSYDLEKSTQMLYASFNSRTVFPKLLPQGFDPSRIMDLGKNPGLGIRKLHARGITGKGVGVAILDQALLTEHVEYADRLRFYEEINWRDWPADMHGPAVASIALGKTVGVAPGADLYFIAMMNGEEKGGKFEMDLGYVAQGLDRIVEVNKKLPRAGKIRVVSISLGMVKEWKNYDAVTRAIERAEQNGILVLTVGNTRFRFDGMERPPLADPEQAGSYAGGIMFVRNAAGAPADFLQVPMDSRTLADPSGPKDYYFSRIGGQSWIVPWVAGLYALACQAKPAITPEQFWKAALETAGPIDFIRDGKKYTLAKVVNPVHLINKLRAK